MGNFALVRRTDAKPETVFSVLTDHRAFPEYTPIRRAELEREGEGDPNGLGAIRVFHLAGPPLREEVITYEPPRRFAYRMLSGLPVRDYVGTVTIEPDGAGSRVVYAVDITPKLALSGPVLIGGTKVAIRQLLGGVIAEAERREARA